MKQVAKKKAVKKKTARQARPKRAAAKRAPRKVARKKAAAKRTPRKAARKKAAAKRTRPRTAPKKTAAKRTSQPAPKKPAARKGPPPVAHRAAAKKRAAARAAAKQAPLRVVGRRDAPKPGSFPQRTGAPLKLAVLFEMARSRTAVLAAIQGLVPGSAERPHGEGKWNTRQYVLHLAHWDRVFEADVEPALNGVVPEWMSYGKAEDDRANAAAMERMNHLTWDEAQRLLHGARQRLLAAIEDLPEESDIWDETHPLGRVLRAATRHDRHHADAIKRWRTETHE